jgi:transcriptional regulator with XRE-family HTH domain
MERFGEKLRQLRTKSGLTLSQLAQKLGLSAHGYISEMESGKKKPTAEIVLMLSRLFEVSTDELLKDELNIEL